MLSRFRLSGVPVAAVLVSMVLFADTPCACDPAQPESMKERQCSLCGEAEKQPPGTDADPRTLVAGALSKAFACVP